MSDQTPHEQMTEILGRAVQDHHALVLANERKLYALRDKRMELAAQLDRIGADIVAVERDLAGSREILTESWQHYRVHVSPSPSV